MQVIFLFGQNNFLLPAFFWSQNLYWGGKCKVGNRPASIMRIRHGLGKKKTTLQICKMYFCRSKLPGCFWLDFFWHLIIPRLEEHCFVARSFYCLCQLLNKLIFLKQKKKSISGSIFLLLLLHFPNACFCLFFCEILFSVPRHPKSAFQRLISTVLIYTTPCFPALWQQLFRVNISMSATPLFHPAFLCCNYMYQFLGREITTQHSPLLRKIVTGLPPSWRGESTEFVEVNVQHIADLGAERRSATERTNLRWDASCNAFCQRLLSFSFCIS